MNNQKPLAKSRKAPTAVGSGDWLGIMAVLFVRPVLALSKKLQACLRGLLNGLLKPEMSPEDSRRSFAASRFGAEHHLRQINRAPEEPVKLTFETLGSELPKNKAALPS